MIACPVCGAAHASCVGTAPFDPAKVFDPYPRSRSATVANDTTVYLPKQHVRRGTASYQATHGDNVQVVDTDGSRRSPADDQANDQKTTAAAGRKPKSGDTES